MASFNGTDLGPACIFSTEGAPPQLQIFAYPAVNGLGLNILGERGAKTTGVGVLYADTPDDLSTLEYNLTLYQVQATEGTLVDAFGTTYDSVIITHFKPATTIPEQAPGFGVARAYEIEFLHLLV